ncbi:MAG: aminotransferase class V-fold PLP-dependent enzyme [Amylibacter sp.]|nr:aminotransferase class V-fold PLP-dependent enzyme [Amylibacter sp.]
MFSKNGLIDEIRARFAHVDNCPFQGDRVFFENAGGALTLKSAVVTSTFYSAIPDNQGRDNVAAAKLMQVIAKAKVDMAVMFNAPSGHFFVGESGTELLFRMIRTAVVESAEGGNVVGSSLEHPATRSAAIRWAAITGKQYVSVPHNVETGSVSAEDYAPLISSDTRVATILHTSPVTGMAVDVAAVAAVIRARAPKCLIIVDGIQHAAHGQLDLAAYGVDGYAVSPYKVFSRHGYGVAWVSGRLEVMDHDMLINGPAESWEFGTRDTGAYATFSDVVDYFDWLGSQVCNSKDRRERIVAAGTAIHKHEKDLTDAMLHGIGNLKGVADIDGVSVIGGVDNPLREGLVSLTVKGKTGQEVVTALNDQGIRTHVRKADHYSGNILDPLGLQTCVRVSMCHYNTEAEVALFLGVMQGIAAEG